MSFYYLGSIVCHALQCIGTYTCSGVLYHYEAVLIIGIDQCESLSTEAIEKTLFSSQILRYGAVIVKMVTSKIRKDSAVEVKSTDSLLCRCMRANFHKSIFATCICHSTEKSIQCQWIRCGVSGRFGPVIHIVANRTHQTGFISHFSE